MPHNNSAVTIRKKHIYIGAVLIVALFIVTFTLARRRSAEPTSASSTTTVKPTTKITFTDAVGKPAPDFTLPSSGNTSVALNSLRGKTVVLFFNEGAMCYPACWNQIKQLGLDQRLHTDKIAAYSIVTDSVSEWKKIFSQKPDYATDMMLFDTRRDVADAYDVMNLKSSMHPGSFPGHTFVIIDSGGTIRYVFDDPSMGIQNEVLLTEVGKLAS